MIREFFPDRQASDYLSFCMGRDVLYDPDTDELREDNGEMIHTIKGTVTCDNDPLAIAKEVFLKPIMERLDIRDEEEQMTTNKKECAKVFDADVSESMTEFLQNLDKMLNEWKGFDVPGINKIFFNGNHTTILWSDNTRTTVGCMEGEKFDEYAGFAAAILKKMFGSSITAKKFLDSHKAVQTPTTKKEKKNA